jgi:hypothetical protein
LLSETLLLAVIARPADYSAGILNAADAPITALAMLA